MGQLNNQLLTVRTMPKENRSVRAAKGLPSTCSGDMCAAVPRVDPGLVRWSLPERMFAAAMRLAEEFRLYLRKAEIQNLGMSALGGEDIRRFDVAVDNAGGVCGIQRICDFDSQRKRGIRINGAPRNPVL